MYRQTQVVIGTDHDQMVVPNNRFGPFVIAQGNKIRINASISRVVGCRILTAFHKDIHKIILSTRHQRQI
jgi:hypothetical protein